MYIEYKYIYFNSLKLLFKIKFYLFYKNEKKSYKKL